MASAKGPGAAVPNDSLAEAMLAHAPGALCLVDAEGRIAKVNPAFEREFDTIAEDVVGLPQSDFLSRLLAPRLAEPESFLRHVRSAYDEGCPLTPIDLHLLRKTDREERWLEFRSDCLGSGWRLESYTDVTARERALRRVNHRLKTIFDAVATWVVLLDREFRVIEVDEVGQADALRNYGQKPEPGKPLTDYISEDLREEMQQNLERCLRGERFRVERELDMFGSGRKEWFEVLHIPLVGEDGEVEALCLQTVSMEGWNLRQVIDLMPVMIHARDVNGRYLLANRAAAEAQGTSVTELVSGDFAPMPLSERERKLLEEDATSITEEEIVAPDGSLRTLQTTKHGFRDAATRAPALLSVSIDFTEVKQAQEQQISYASTLEREVSQRTSDLRLVNQELRELQTRLFHAERLSAAEELAGSVAHSINNPLAALLGVVELELESLGDPNPTLERVLHLGKRIENVVEGTLQLFRRGSLELALESPGEILTDVRDEIRSRFVAPVQGVELKVASGLPRILVDRVLLLAALTSIAENAIEALGAEGSLFLEVDHAPCEGAVRFRVSDTGPGIPEPIREKALEPFFTTKGGGTGLGLAIANGVVQGHRGSIRIGDRPGGGASIEIDLPATGT